MLNQVTRALAALISPISTRGAAKSDSDRDAMGQAYENLHDQKKEKEPETPSEPVAAAEGSSNELAEAPAAQVIAIQGPTPEELQEARKREIGNSQVWMGLKIDLEEQRAIQGEQPVKASGPDAYEKANAGSSKTARTKKGVILDKKAA